METVKKCSVHGTTMHGWHVDKRLSEGGRWRCRVCQIEYTSQNKQRVREVAARIKLERGCVRCGYDRFAPALHFAHRDSKTKLYTPSQCRSISKLLAEIEKCDVMCANCHIELDQGYTPLGV